MHNMTRNAVAQRDHFIDADQLLAIADLRAIRTQLNLFTHQTCRMLAAATSSSKSQRLNYNVRRRCCVVVFFRASKHSAKYGTHTVVAIKAALYFIARRKLAYPLSYTLTTMIARLWSQPVSLSVCHTI